jgi:hypothetical protein
MSKDSPSAGAGAVRPERPDRRAGRGVGGAVPFGVALIAVGVLLLLGQLDVLDPARVAAEWWPLLVIGAGLWWLFTRAWLTGAFALGAGLLLLGITLGVLDAGLGNLIFPLFLLLVGLLLLTSGVRLRRATAVAGDTTARHGPAAQRPAGHVDRRPSATAVFGDARLRLYDDGDDPEALVASVTSVFGDVHVQVPAGWRVRNRTSALFGDVKIPRDQPTYPEAPVAELHGLVLFGDLKVRYEDPEEV